MGNQAIPMFDVVVAGGGIGGLSFALAARAAGLRVSVLERSANVVRANLGGGLGLWPPSQQVLRELGVLPALIARGRYMPAPRYCDHRGQVLGQPTRHFAERFPILCVERSVLLEVLEARCVEVGVRLRPACELRSYTVTDADAAPVLLELATPQGVDHLATDLLVGADGIHSRVRRQMLADRAVTPQHCGYSYLHALAFESWGQGIRFGYVPMREPQVFWFMAVPIGHAGLQPEPGARALTDAEKHGLLQRLATWQGPVLPDGSARLDLIRLVQATAAEEILRTDIYKVAGVTRFPWADRSGRVVLLGDACHATAPNLAQGAGLSIEDAAQLAWQLRLALDALPRTPGARKATDTALKSALQAYAQGRKPRAWMVQTLADTVARVGQLRGALAAARDASMRLPTRHLPALSGRIFEAVVARSLGAGPGQLSWETPNTACSPVEAVLGTATFERALSGVDGEFRRRRDGGRGQGLVSVRIGPGWLPRVIAGLFALPPPMQEQPFEAGVSPLANRRQRWTRRFAGVAYTTTMGRIRDLGAVGGAGGLLLSEGIGGWLDRWIRFGYRVHWDAPTSTLCFDSCGLWWADRIRLPLPGWLQARSDWTERPAQIHLEGQTREGWHFEGRIRLPALLGGQSLMRYAGSFVPELAPEATSEPEAAHAIVLGGSGLLGRALCGELLRRGWRVTVPRRTPEPAATRCTHPAYREIHWDPAQPEAAVAGLRAAIDQHPAQRLVLINLAGENPGARRWSAACMQRILQSRLAVLAILDGLLRQLRAELAQGLRPASTLPVAILQASAVGLYGDRGAEPLSDLPTFNSASAVPPAGPQRWLAEAGGLARGRRFRIDCCEDIEAAAAALATLPGSAAAPWVVLLRIGMVLAREGGLLPHLQRAAMAGVSRLGSGRQQVSWIHLADAARVIAEIADAPATLADPGSPCFAVHVCAPQPVANAELLRHARAALRRALPPALPLPARALEWAIGPAACVVLDSQAALPERLRQRLPPERYARLFHHPDVAPALRSWECMVDL
ncbi:MAG: FAD-dependent monooxygenase [Xanthomonadales bacterium]|nr:FAD-dependent monooxygenase [Xanthomonadales bacterium]